MLTRPRETRGPSGFTLIELVVVIVIIGLLATIASATYINAVNGSREKAVIDQALKVDAELRRAALRPVTAAAPGQSFDPYANARKGPDANPRIVENVKRLRSDVGDGSAAPPPEAPAPAPGAPEIPPSGEIEASVAFPQPPMGAPAPPPGSPYTAGELEFQQTGYLAITLNGKTACLTVSLRAGEAGSVAEKVLDSESETCEDLENNGANPNWA